MKIAIICFNLSWQSGGPRLIFAAAQALKNKGHTVRIYTPEFSGKYYTELWAGLDIKTVPWAAKELLPVERAGNFLSWVLGKIKRERAQLRAAKKVASAMDTDFDLVNVHDFAYPVAYFYKQRNPQARVIWTENDPPYMYLPKKSKGKDLLSRLYNQWKDVEAQKYFKTIDAVSVLDSYNEAWCRARGLSATIVRLGVDFEKFYLPVKDFHSKARKKQVTLFGLGSLNSYRRYEDIILAAKHLLDWGYDPKAIIISNDMWNESSYRNKLLGLVKDNKLEDRIEFNFKGVSEEGLKNVYRESDFFVYPMYVPPPRNGFGFSIGVFEAMAAGLPVILCRTTTSTEVLKDGESALFVDPEGSNQVAEKVKYILENPEKYREIAKAGQEFVKKNLTWESYTKNFLALFQNR